jgi:hypothetical protein
MTLENIMARGEVPLVQKSEMGEIFENLDSDEQDPKTKMSNVDVNTRLTPKQISACLVFDEMQRLGLFPDNWSISRQLKRLQISEKGLGRKEKIQVAQSMRDHKVKTGFPEKFKGLFKRQGDE